MRQRPPSIQLFLDAFTKHAERLLLENPGNRNEDTQARVDEIVNRPWDHDLKKPLESRQTTFLRDFFNSFQEVTLACDYLDTIMRLAPPSMENLEPTEADVIHSFWAESYLNEIYIFALRVTDMIKFIERRYGKDKDFAEPVKAICKGLLEKAREPFETILKIRGTHVHEHRSRHFDPELSRLRMLTVFVVAKKRVDLQADLENAAAESAKWLLKQITYYSETAWQVFDLVCEVFGAGIITDNGWIIIPDQHKDRTSG